MQSRNRPAIGYPHWPTTAAITEWFGGIAEGCVTGGGLAGTLQRVIPHGLVAEVDRGTWTPAPVFATIAQRGRVGDEEMEKTFTMGVGMIAVVAPEDTDRALAILTARHLDCWVLGTVGKGKDGPRAKLAGRRNSEQGASTKRSRADSDSVGTARSAS